MIDITLSLPVAAYEGLLKAYGSDQAVTDAVQSRITSLGNSQLASSADGVKLLNNNPVGLIPNGDFSDGDLSNWTITNGSPIVAPGESRGTPFSVRFNANGAIEHTLPSIEPRTQIDVLVYARTNNGTSDINLSARDTGQGSVNWQPIEVTDEWRPYTFSFVIGEAAATPTISLSATIANPSNAVLLDSVTAYFS